ncbi:MAG: acyltransferase family protein [Ilumatobacteraceae bacterium]
MGVTTGPAPRAETAPTVRGPRPISGVPYLPGLDGLRALAVVAVMVYHAHASWLPGGFLGVEVFFVISGYLITLLLMGEHERSGRIRLTSFYARRAKRLLPALYTMLLLLTVYTAIWRREALGQLRGDIVAGITYVSNWYQIWVGQSYTSSGDFAPLRHLWSLAVEEQFYVLWPLVMIVLLRLGSHRVQDISWGLLVAAIAISAAVAALVYRGPVGTCAVTPDAYWHVRDRCISINDFLYLSTPTRAGGLLIGAALATVWRPVALMRGPMRRRGRVLDVAAVVGLVALAGLAWSLRVVTPDGADRWLFRGGFLATGIATIVVIAAVAHRGSLSGRVLGNAVLVWIGTRSYGLYLYHWPIYQGVRRVAGNTLTVPQFVAATAATVVVTELSYRLIEMPIRTGTIRVWWRRWQSAGSDGARRTVAAVGALVVVAVVASGAALATAPLRQNAIAEAQEEGRRSTGDPFATTTTLEGATATVASTSTMPSTTGAPVTVTTLGASADVPVVLPGTSTTGPTPVAAPPTPEPPPPDAAGPASAAPAPTALPLPPAGVDPCGLTPIVRYAIGDSVMLGASGNLAAAGFCVDAIESRAFINGLDQVIRLHAAGRLGSAVVVGLGTNGPIGHSDLDRMMAELAGVPRVVVVTTRADRSWVAANNDTLRALPDTYPNVVVVDWAVESAACPGSCFYDDGIHLRPAGRAYYARLVTAALA